jgi:uncharacterized protein (TIGR03435 family)
MLAFAALSAAAFAQDLTGTWQGILIPPNQNDGMKLVFKIDKNGNAYQGHFFNLSNGRQLNFADITFQGNTVKFTIPGNGMNYEGKIEADGNSITGNLVLQGTTQALPLKRATAETAWEIPPPPAPPKAMAANVDPSFEVATIKPAPPGQQGMGINVNATGQFSTRNTSLKDLLIFAYGVHPDQIQGLPAWAEGDKYDILGKPDHEGMGNDTQIRSMMKKLLAERFGLTTHHEKKELSAFTLNVDKSGPKLTVNESGVNLPGFGGRGPGSIGVNNATMEQFAGFLQARIVDRPVVDKTGLTGKYDFTLTWRPDQLAAPQPNAPPLPADIESRPDIFKAMQEQLGLKFQQEKTAVEVLVIDKVAKPSEN